MKQVTSWRGHLHTIAPASITASFEEMSKGWRAVGNTVTGTRFDLRPLDPETNVSTIEQPVGYVNSYVLESL